MVYDNHLNVTSNTGEHGSSTGAHGSSTGELPDLVLLLAHSKNLTVYVLLITAGASFLLTGAQIYLFFLVNRLRVKSGEIEREERKVPTGVRYRRTTHLPHLEGGECVPPATAPGFQRLGSIGLSNY